MSDEIKEILDKLKDENNYQVDCNDGSAFKELFANEINLLLDYITNLQEEITHLDKVNCHLRKKINNDIYKSRIEKAAEYMQNHQLVFRLSNKKQIEEWFDEFYKNMSNILGGDK